MHPGVSQPLLHCPWQDLSHCQQTWPIVQVSWLVLVVAMLCLPTTHIAASLPDWASGQGVSIAVVTINGHNSSLTFHQCSFCSIALAGYSSIKRISAANLPAQHWALLARLHPSTGSDDCCLRSTTIWRFPHEQPSAKQLRCHGMLAFN